MLIAINKRYIFFIVKVNFGVHKNIPKEQQKNFYVNPVDLKRKILVEREVLVGTWWC